MPPISKDIALKFCGLCNWVYEAWITHKLLFDDNEAQKDSIGKAAAFMVRLSTITQEYSLLQIAKLHDPAIQKNSLNLTVDYMMRFGEWGERRGTIENIFARLLE